MDSNLRRQAVLSGILARKKAERKFQHDDREFVGRLLAQGRPGRKRLRQSRIIAQVRILHV